MLIVRETGSKMPADLGGDIYADLEPAKVASGRPPEVTVPVEVRTIRGVELVRVGTWSNLDRRVDRDRGRPRLGGGRAPRRGVAPPGDQARPRRPDARCESRLGLCRQPPHRRRRHHARR